MSLRDPKAALEAMTHIENTHGLGSVFRWNGHAIATNGKSLLVLIGLGDLGEKHAPDFLCEVVVGWIRKAKGARAVSWPYSGFVVPATCSECSGSGVTFDAPACWTCGGTGVRNPRDRGYDPVTLCVHGEEGAFNLALLLEDLHRLSPVERCELGEEGGRRALYASGDGWRYVLMGLDTKFVGDAEKRVEIASAGATS